MATTKTKSANKSATKKKSSPTTAGKSAQNGSMLEDFIVDMMKDIYWAEKHLVKALGKMIKATTTQELKDAFEEHRSITETHVSRLEQAFEMMGKKAQAKKCDAMEGLTKEADSIVEETEKGSMTRDVALIIAAQKVEHYEIASYGGLVQLCKTAGMEDVAELLHQTLTEEKEADELLTQIAENNINWEAENETE